jgi:nucleotide-binding universal stress UspA family protein
MAKQRGFKVVVASDGSPTARAAIGAAVAFPWPPGTHVHGVVARTSPGAVDWSPTAWAAIDEALRQIAEDTRKWLVPRWPDAEVSVVDPPPVEGILRAARGADAVVMGSRGHGPVGRFFMGSVSRGVVQAAKSPVLVVKGRVRGFSRFVVGMDGSENARRAVGFLARLATPRGGQMTLVGIVEPVAAPSMALMPAAVRATLGQEVKRLHEDRLAAARREVEDGAMALKKLGWTVKSLVRSGTPLEGLLDVVKSTRADCLVLGARGTGGLERLVLGSVAMGALSRAAAPVLIVR